MSREQQIDRVVRFALWSLWPYLSRHQAAQLAQRSSVRLRHLTRATARLWRQPWGEP